MNHWLFIVMYDSLPESWRIMVEAGVAAEHYPPGWNNETNNLRALRQLKRGDVIVAAFKNHRFAGYGTLTSDFYRGGPSLEICKDANYFEFSERFNCDWTIIPLESAQIFVRCKDLKEQGFDIDLTRGRCVKQIDKATFGELRTRLDEAGARKIVRVGGKYDRHHNLLSSGQRAWIVQADINANDGEGWHWSCLFKDPEQMRDWGGAEWIRQARSRSRVLNEFAAGDLAFCYQAAPDKAILGIGRIGSGGHDYNSRTGKTSSAPGLFFDFEWVEPIDPLPLSVLKDDAVLANTEKCRIAQGTIFRVSEQETRRLLELVTVSPQLRKRLRQGWPSVLVPYVRRAGARGNLQPAAGRTGRQAPGQGYGLTQSARQAIDKFAMHSATIYFTKLGYHVQNKSANHPYDLLCCKGSQLLYVEVKGTVTKGESVHLTSGEVRFARAHPRQMALAVMHSIKLDDRRERPIDGTGILKVLSSWNVNEGTLEPTEYVYAPP